MTEIENAPTPDAGHSLKVTTTYIVLERQVPGAVLGGLPEGDDKVDTTSFVKEAVWKEVGEITAKGQLAARQAYAEKSGSTTPLVLRAVPKRHWGDAVTFRPKTVTMYEVA